MSLTLALIIWGPIHHLSFRRRLEGLIVLLVEAECRFCLDPCLKESIEVEVILTLAYSSAYLGTQSGPEEHALVVIDDVSILAGSNNIGAKRRNGPIGASLR